MAQTNKVKTPDGAVRQRLLRAASELFAQKGYAATTVREIVAAAGVTKPVLYYYFGSKEGLYLELMGSVTKSFLGILKEPPPAGATARQRIVRLGEMAFQLFCEHLQVMKIMHAIYYGPPQGAPFVDFDALHEQFQDELVRLVQEGMANGEFRAGDAQVMAWALLGVEHLAMELELCMPGQRMGLEGLRQVTDLTLDGIAASKTIGG
ncbi:MAG: TetR/AcrR family transcriptional regulator [Desulfarculus sp.]|nr:TetR/AcrR family transcriptional regulator [Desulfarculus sp.]